MLRFLTAGESHGRALLGILEGMPAGLKINQEYINNELSRRQAGFGRGQRMKIEKDRIEIIAGLKNSITLGSPIGLLLENKDFRINTLAPVFFPRPGHGDLAGILKYGFTDARWVLERASARETAMRVAIGSICKIFLQEFKIVIESQVIEIGGQTNKEMMQSKIKEARRQKDTLGGVFEVVARNVPAGLGSYVHYDRRLDGQLAMAVMSIPAVKAVEIGLGFGYKDKMGSQVHDSIYFRQKRGFVRSSNNAGGIEAGVSNGEDIIIRGCMKPIATLGNPLDSVDIRTKKPHKAALERYDTCAVFSASVIAEATVAFEICKSFLEKFGCDSLQEIKRNFLSYLKVIKGN